MELHRSCRDASSPTTPLAWLPELILRRGRDPDATCRSVGLGDTFRRDPLKPFPLSDYFEVLNGLMRHLDLPNLGALIGERLRIVDLVRVAPILDTSETVEEALCRVCAAGTKRFLPGCRVALAINGRQCLLHVEMPPGSVEIQRPFMEILLYSLRLIVQRAIGPAWSPQRVLFRHRNASSSATLQRGFGGSAIQFGQRYNGLEFSTALLGKLVPPRSLDFEILRHVAHRELVCRRASIDQMARLFGLSRRSLQRRLSERNMNYRGLLLKLRMELACDYLDNTQGSIASIAQHLGYNHHRDFTRSFKRCFGTSPLGYRRRSVS